MKKAIIIFVRNPELGKVKTRLAKEIGDEQTLKIYKELLQHTHNAAINVDCDKFVYYADYINENDLWENELFQKKMQAGEVLGDRMMLAFMELFQQGYSKIIIIGSDCPQLTSFVLVDAFDMLGANEVVIGPSSDGGYYLLGLTKLIPELFTNKQWSTDTVLADTIKDTVRLGKACVFLPELFDVDTAGDLLQYQQMQKA